MLVYFWEWDEYERNLVMCAISMKLQNNFEDILFQQFFFPSNNQRERERDFQSHNKNLHKIIHSESNNTSYFLHSLYWIAAVEPEY